MIIQGEDLKTEDIHGKYEGGVLTLSIPKREEQKKVDEKSEYFGKVGKRYKNLNVYDIRILSGWETQFGYTYLYRIILEGGNILTWKSSNWYSEDELREMKTIDFSIKNHIEYKGTKQTEVTRCKLHN